MLQKTLFSLRSSNTHHNIPFNFQFFYELKAKASSILKNFARGFHFLFHLGFTKVYLYFEGVPKNCESVKKGNFLFLIGIHSMQGRTATTSFFARKETADIDILVTSRNCGRKIMQSIRITSRLPSREGSRTS